MKILFLTRYGRLGASSRLRTIQYLPFLTTKGIKCTCTPLFDDKILSTRYIKLKYTYFSLVKAYIKRIKILIQKNNYDLLWIEKEALPWFPYWLEHLFLKGKPIIIDYDDAIFHNYDKHPSILVRLLFGKRIQYLMQSANLIIAGSSYIALCSKNFGVSWVEKIPTVVDQNRYFVKKYSKKNENKITIVWIGSPSTAPYLNLIFQPILILSMQYPIRLRIIGSKEASFPGVETEFFEWTEDTEASLLSECDIGVMPLSNSEWDKGKCGYKLIQYMACGLPVVASDVGENSIIVKHGINGYLAKNEADWIEYLLSLCKSFVLRKNMGNLGRKLVEEEYSLSKLAPKIEKLIKQVLKHN